MLQTVTTKPGKKYASIRNPRVYEALRKRGMSKQRAARISNAQASKDVDTVAGTPLHGPGGLLGVPGLGKRGRKWGNRRKSPDCTCGVNVATKESLGPGVTRIRGNLCNVHGRYGPCDAGAAAAKKPPKGKKGRKPKVPAKAKPEQRLAARQQQQTENRSKVLSGLGIGADGQAALEALRGGQQPDAAAILSGGFEQAGLVERAADGSYRLTASGRAAMNAANSGDQGRAGDIISAARDRLGARQGRQAAAEQRKQEVAARRAAAEEARKKKQAEAAKKRGSSGGSKQPTGGSGAAYNRQQREAEHQADRERRLSEHQQDRERRLREHEADRARRESERTSRTQQQTAQQATAPPERVSSSRPGVSTPSRRRGRMQRGNVGTRTKAQSAQDRAMFAKMGGGGGGGGSGGGKGGGGGGESKLWPRDPKTGKREAPAGYVPPAKGGLPGIPPIKPGERVGPEVFRARDAALSARQKRREAEVSKQSKPPAIIGGSEKQQAFARDIRDRTLRDAEKRRAQILESAVNKGQQDIDAQLKKVDAAISKLRERTDSRYWIDNRGSDVMSLIRSHAEKSTDAVAFKAGDPGDYLIVEDREKPTTWHLQVKKNGKADHRLMGAAAAALTVGYRGNKYEGPNKGAALAKLKKLYKQESMPFPGENEKSFTVFKSDDGSYRWIARTTTAYRDRDGEIITTKALETDAERMTATGQYGPLRYWHLGMPDPFDPAAPWGTGVDIGDCDYSTVIGRTSVESGTFKSADIGAAFAQAADEYELSPGFFHPIDQPTQAGEYEEIRRFERSVVPIKYGRASNLFTGMTVKESRMDTQEYERRMKVFAADMNSKGVPPEVAGTVIAGMEQADKSAQAQGVAYKTDDPWQAVVAALKAAVVPATPAAPPMDAEDDPALGGDSGVDEAAEGEPPTDDGSGDGEYIGDMSPAAFKSMMGEVLAPVLKMQDMLKAMSDMHGELKGMMGSATKADNGRTAEIASLKARLARLEGDQPAVVNNADVEAALKGAPQAPPDPNAPIVPDDPARPYAAVAARTFPNLYRQNPDGSFAGWQPPMSSS